MARNYVAKRPAIVVINDSQNLSPERYHERCLGKDIFVSNDTRKTHLNNNDLIIGSTGSCKTGSIVYTQLKMLRDTSLIVADSKGALHKMFKDELIKKGYSVKVLDFVNPERSCKYNPLDYVRKNADGTYNEVDIMKISAALLPNDLSGDDQFWVTSARAFLDFFIAHTLMAYPKESQNMYTVYRNYRAYIQGGDEGGFIADFVDSNRGTLLANRYMQMKAIEKADRTLSSILAFANVAFQPFDVANLKNIFHPNKNKRENPNILDIESIGKRKTVVFLNISDTDNCLDKLVNLFYTQVLQTLVTVADNSCKGQLRVPCRIIFDDFAAGTIIPDFDKIISIIRSRDIWVTILIQSLSQLESLYSRPQRLTIQNNCDHIVYMGCNDQDTAYYIGTRACKVPEEILAMERTKEYILEGGKKAILADKVPPYSYTEDIKEKTV